MTITEKIINNWFEKGKKSDIDEYDKFIYLWISFNAYYCSLCYNEDGKLVDYIDFLAKETKENKEVKKDGDGNRIKFFIYRKNEEFNKFIVKNKELESFYKFINGRIREDSKRIGGVIDLSTGDKSTYKEINNFGKFIFIIYQVRNNLFHGGKDYGAPNDEKLLKEINLIFESFLEYIYKT